MSTWTYNINNLSNLPEDKLTYLLEKYEYETPQLDEDSIEYKRGIDSIVKIRTEIDRRGQEGQ
ncbi:hypothetical protein LT012_18065 [Vibrio cholerae]|uniref:hypothetical protein n=1 Tax=Vibrio cholerae TaxID=666 RepID=UPI001E3E0AD1|nr:hypothetical protein [Vibrio cholerae]MCD6725305.1 hypothetical protein [Vibrio cholerae]